MIIPVMFVFQFRFACSTQLVYHILVLSVVLHEIKYNNYKLDEVYYIKNKCLKNRFLSFYLKSEKYERVFKKIVSY